MGVRIRGSQIYKGSIDDDRMSASAIAGEVAIPVVTKDQSVTSDTLSTLIGRYLWKPSSWNSDLIESIEVELEYESAGAGDVDLYDATSAAKLADLVAPTAAQSHTLVRVEVTDVVTALTSNTQLAIQAAGDGTNAVTVYKATMIVTLST